MYLTLHSDQTAVKPKRTSKRTKVVNLHASVGPDIDFKCIVFPTAKRPNLGIRKAFVSCVTSGANSKAMTLISACIETAKHQAAI